MNMIRFEFFKYHTPLDNLSDTCAFLGALMGTFHLSISEGNGAAHGANRIASFRSPSGFSFGDRHCESDIHSMIETTPCTLICLVTADSTRT